MSEAIDQQHPAATDKLPGIHALRVLAAVTVYLLHVLNLTATQVESATKFSNNLHYGVPLFFAVSAFSLMYSTQSYRGTGGWVGKFYVKRYFRIAPLFYFMLVVDVLLTSTMSLGFFFPQMTWPTWDAVLLNLTFLFGLSPAHVSSLVLIGWSVGAEMLFYLLFPLLLISLRSVWSALAFVLFSHVIGEVSRPLLDPLVSLGFTVVLSDLHVLPNLRYFAFGILAFHIFARLRATRFATKDAGIPRAAGFHLVCAAMAIVLITLLVYYAAELKALWHLDMAAWGALFCILCVWLTIRPVKLLNYAPIQYLGERSYSLYLVHFPTMLLLTPFTTWVFNALQPAIGAWAIAASIGATYIPVVVISAITYRFIERPGMDLGRTLSRRIGRRDVVIHPSATAE